MARRKAFAILALLAGFWPATGAVAQWSPAAVQVPAADPFQIRDVPVDVTAATVTEARERGLTQARVAAFQKLVERMVQREAVTKIAMPTTAQIIDMVLEFSVANERSSAVRYLADITVRFNPSTVRAFLRGQGVPFADTASRPMVIVPVLQEGGQTLLWQDANPWRDAWAMVIPHDGLVPFVLPLGDLDDIGLATVEQALEKDRDALGRLAAKYKAAGAIVARAAVTGNTIAMTFTEVRPIGAEWEGRANVPLAADQPREDSFFAAAEDAARAIDEGWKDRNILRFGQGGTITALVPIQTLQDWLAVKSRLGQVPVIERVELQAMSKTLVQCIIVYAGEPGQLQFALGQRDLDLVQDGDIWMLKSALARASAGPEAGAAVSPRP